MSRLDINIDRHHSHAIANANANVNTLSESTSHDRNTRGLQATVRALSVDNHGVLSRRNLLRLLNQAFSDNLFSFQHQEGTLKGEPFDERSWFLVAKLLERCPRFKLIHWTLHDPNSAIEDMGVDVGSHFKFEDCICTREFDFIECY